MAAVNVQDRGGGAGERCEGPVRARMRAQRAPIDWPLMSAHDGPVAERSLIDTISAPQDLRRLSSDELTLLAAQIRDFLVTKVSRTGGHLGPNLGLVELTLALHRVFDSPMDRILFDTGHQAHLHTT